MKKKDNKEVKRDRRNTPKGNFLMSNAFLTKREMQKEMTNQDTQGYFQNIPK